MEEAGYNITEKEFKKISKWAENIYNIAIIVDYFISNQSEIEECYDFASVIKNLYRITFCYHFCYQNLLPSAIF